MQTVLITEVITTTITVTETPGTVTILQQDPSSVAASMASVDTAQIRQSSLLNPVSNSVNTENPVFTHSVHVSGYEATELSNGGGGSSVFYMSKGQSTTDWSFTPSASIVAEVTTVTVLPVPAPPTQEKGAPLNTTTSHFPFTSPPAGWNSTTKDWNTIDPIGTNPIPGSTLSPSASETSISQPVDTTSIVTVTKVTTEYVSPNGYPAPSVTQPPAVADYGAVPANGYEAPVQAADDGRLEKRQTCYLIYATIGGQLASWCNNWSGQTVLTYTHWDTTGNTPYHHTCQLLTYDQK